MCKKFADIGLNMPKIPDKNNLSVQAAFHYKDIENAKSALVAFIKVHRIDDVKIVFKCELRNQHS